MTLIEEIEVSAGGEPLQHFQDISIREDIYGIDNFEIICPYEAIEDLDAFLIEKAKDLLGSVVLIKIKAREGGNVQDALLFKGIVTEVQGTRSSMDDNNMVIISGGSLEILLNGKPNTRVFIDKTLEDIVNDVLNKYPSGDMGFKKNVAPHDSFTYPYIVQYEESDLEFLKRLSIRYGEWFYFDGESMNFGETSGKQKDLVIGPDLDTFTYQLRLNPVKFTLLADDPLKTDVHKTESGSKKVDSNVNKYGKHAFDKSAEIYDTEGIRYYENLNVKETDYAKGLEKVVERDVISDALNLSDLSGTSGNPFLTAGLKISVSCLKKENGDPLPYLSYMVTSVQHQFNNLLSYSNSFSAVPVEIKIPENTDPFFIRTSHNQIGRITNNQDPEKLGRVKITFPWMDNADTPWVKVVTPYTQAKSGFYFVPAVNSRVLVGFEGGDVEKPYCLGALFDKNHPPDAAWAGDYNDKDANIQAIRTVSGQTIEFHDESGSEKIRIYDTNNKNEITLDTANGEIKIKATEKLTLEAKEIEIKAQNGIKIEAGQTLEQKGMDVKTEAQTSLEAKATSVEITANASLKASGSASTEVSSSGVMTIKGSMVMIN